VFTGNKHYTTDADLQSSEPGFRVDWNQSGQDQSNFDPSVAALIHIQNLDPIDFNSVM